MGGLVFLSLIKSTKTFIEHIKSSKILKYVLGYLTLCSIHLLVSVFTKTNWYYYFRNSVIFYSAFAFFIGYGGYVYFKPFLKRYKLALQLYLVIGLALPSIQLIDRFSTSLIFPFLFKRLKTVSFVGIIVFNLLLAFQYNSMTVTIVLILLIGIVLMPNFKSFKLTSFILLFAFITGMVYYTPNFKKYTAEPYIVFGNTEAVAEGSKLLLLDANSTWRAVFWYRVCVEKFPENLTGIGFGTPLLGYKENTNSFCTNPNDYLDEHDVHVTGAHNTYLTLGVRLGLIFIFLIVAIFKEVFSSFYKRKSLKNGAFEDLIYLSFFSISIVGLFNLMLETPTLAAIFWVLLGLITAQVKNSTKGDELMKAA